MADTVQDVIAQALATSRGNGAVIFQTDRNDAAAVLQALTAARLAVVPVPEGDVVEDAAKVLGHGYWGELPDRATYLERKSARGHWADREEIRADIRSLYPIIAAAEREACAEFVRQNGGYMDPDDLAAAIRAGGRP